MLAYVFWHWTQANVAIPIYETAQRRFHAALAAAPSDGYSRSHSAGVHGLPWANADGATYEDWYLVHTSAALDPLNAAAISASRQAPHDAAAALAAGGVAGIYQLRLGKPLRAPTRAMWFAKPAGMSYAQLDAALRELVAGGACLWMRYMVLGPSPEFCLHGAGLELPQPLAGLALDLRTVWPEKAVVKDGGGW